MLGGRSGGVWVVSQTPRTSHKPARLRECCTCSCSPPRGLSLVTALAGRGGRSGSGFVAAPLLLGDEIGDLSSRAEPREAPVFRADRREARIGLHGAESP